MRPPSVDNSHPAMPPGLIHVGKTWRPDINRKLESYLERALRHPGIVSNAFISAKLIPLERQRIFDGENRVVVEHPMPVGTTGPDGLPVPPQELWEGWGATAEIYLESGRRDTEAM